MSLSQSRLIRPLSLVLGVVVLQACTDIFGYGYDSEPPHFRSAQASLLADVTGVVKSAANTSPVVGARVFVLNPDDAGQHTVIAAGADTKANGRYRIFSKVRCRASRMRVTHPAYVDKSADFRCTSDHQVLNLTLEPRS